jgi:hypothetical protein
MTAWIVLAGLTIALTLSSLLVSFWLFYRTQALSRFVEAEVQRACAECAHSMEAMRKRFEEMATERHDAPRSISAEPLPGAAKSAINLSRRSQALRLRRKGESPRNIAERLEIPRQEVDLLLKVHEIVLNNL